MPIDLPGLLAEDELTELVDADIPRVDLVGKGANGIPRFLVMKDADGSASGLMDPGFVRDLIAKAGPEPSATEEVVTMTGSPAAIAKLIHGAPIRPAGKTPEEAAVAVATVTKDMPATDDSADGMDPTMPLAEPDGDYPGSPAEPGSPAWEAVDAATACKWTSILSRARVAVDMLADREMLEAASGDDGDACNAMDLADVCYAIDYAISVLAPFAVAEQSEADCGEMGAMAMVGKSAEDREPLEAVRKAMAPSDLGGPLSVIESIGVVVRKTGRVLSGANEAHLREAANRLNTVLSSLPQAPTDDGLPVAKSKETTVTATETAPAALSDEAKAALNGAPGVQVAKAADNQGGDAGPVADTQVPGMGAIPGRPASETMDTPSGRRVLKAAVYDQRRTLLGLVAPDRIAQVAKADGDGKVTMQAVFNEDGELVGIVDPADITPVAGAGGSGDADPDGDGTQAAMPADAATDMTPAPAGETGTPAGGVGNSDDVAKQDGTITQDMLKSIAQDAARTAIEAQSAAHQEVIAKMATDKEELAEELKVVKARLETVENTPAQPKVFTNGQTPPAHQMRGQDQGGTPPVDILKARELKETLYRGTAPQQQEAFKEMQAAAIDGLAALHSARQR